MPAWSAQESLPARGFARKRSHSGCLPQALGAQPVLVQDYRLAKPLPQIAEQIENLARLARKNHSPNLREMSPYFLDLHRAVVDESHGFGSDVPGGQDLSNGFGLRSPICHDRKKSILLDQQVRTGESVLDQCRVVFACNGKQHPALRKRFEQLLIQATDLTPPESTVKETPGAPASPRMPCQSVPSKSVIK